MPRFFFLLCLLLSAPAFASSPQHDRDQDGLPDVKDVCPDDPEDRDGFEDEDGCPDPDNDRDGILDHLDKCPNTPEDIDGFEDTDGCPDLDNDKDNISDHQDQCPNLPETVNGINDEDGCPDSPPCRLPVGPTSFEIREKIYFKAGSTKIAPNVAPILDEIAAVLKAHPEEIKRLQIEGHQDATEMKKIHQDLGEFRAQAVRQALLKRGIKAARLKIISFGEDRPLMPNKTAEGRAKNRRVGFKVLK